MAREFQAQFAQESKRREAGSLAEDPHQGRAGDPGFHGKRASRPARAPSTWLSRHGPTAARPEAS
jgi:hypothetical protein